MRAKPIGAVLLAVASLNLLARAGGDADPVRVRFDGHAGCPSEEAFFDEVRARTPRVRRAVEGEAALTFRASVRRSGDRSVGRLVVEEPSRASAPRVVEAATCDEAVAALALIAALSVDPNAASPDAGPRDAPIDAAAPDAAIDAEAPAIDSGAAITFGAPLVPSAPPPAPEPERPPAALRPWAIAAGGGLTLPSLLEGSGVAPSLFVELAWERGPSLRLSGERVVRDADPSSTGNARMVWWTGALDACPLHTPSFTLSACAAFEAGLLEAEASGIGTQSRTRAWLAAGLAGRARPLRLDLSSSAQLFVEIELALRAPLIREAFYFEPDDTVYRAPVLIFRAGLSAGLRFR